MKTTTTVFGTQTTWQKVRSRKIAGKIGVLPILGLLILAGSVAAVILGPLSSQKTATVREYDVQVNAPVSPWDISWGNLFSFNAQTKFTVTPTVNSYTQAHVAYILIDVAGISCATLTGYGIDFRMSADGVTYTAITGIAGNLVNNGPSQYSASDCVFFSTSITHNVAAGSLADTWSAEFLFSSPSVSGVGLSFSAQAAEGATP